MPRMTTEYRRKFVDAQLLRGKIRTNYEIFKDEMIKNERNARRS